MTPHYQLGDLLVIDRWPGKMAVIAAHLHESRAGTTG
jgi:hypothetical protein